MLRQIADGVLVHESEFLQSNAVVVRGGSGVLLIDAGITGADMTCLAGDVARLGAPVLAGFSTHPHWDHVLWHPSFGDAPRYGTAACVEALEGVMAEAGWREREAEELPPEIAGDVPFDLYGQLVALPEDASAAPWDGPRVRVIEHRAHAPGHAALLIEAARVLVAGDMLSDTLIPFLDMSASDPIADYLAALDLFEGVASGVDAVVPGHGSVGDADALRARVALDRAYIGSLLDGPRAAVDPRLDPSAPNGSWLPDVDAWQRKQGW